MAGVHSVRFILAQSAGPVKYTVPPGKRAIIKNVTVVNTNAGTVQGYLYIASTNIWNTSVPGTSASQLQGLHVVVNAGEELVMGSGGAALGLHCSGYLLDMN